MTESEDIELERNTIFVLAGLLLASLVSIAFFNLDSHPAFSRPSQDFIDELNRTKAPIVFAQDPLALAVLDERHGDLHPVVRPLQSWPPKGPVVNSGSVPAHYTGAKMELVAEDSLWSLWNPTNFSPLPYLGTATVELEDREGTITVCEPDAEGGHQCGSAGWTRMRYRQITVDGQARQCIWAHPIEDKTLRFRFPDVVTITDEDRRLHLETGLRDAAVGAGGAIDFHIRVGNDVTRHRHVDRRGWQSIPLATTTEPTELVIDISARRVGRRHLCFDFDLQ